MTVQKKIVEYFNLLQIFDRLGKERKDKLVQRKELVDCCFVYASPQKL